MLYGIILPAYELGNSETFVIQKEPSMKTAKTILVLVLIIASSYVIRSMVRADSPDTKTEKAKLRVGTFDSRAIAIAYGGSEQFNQSIRKLMEEHKKAKAEGNDKKVKQLEAEGQARQQLAHMQAFSTASVSDILERIKDQIPGIAQQAGVDVIVSKWDLVYQSPDAEFFDVTDLMIKPFNPSERVLKWAEDIRKHPPISLDEAKNLKD
jgi:hypothetical protein